MILSQKNSHPRDSNGKFDEEPHEYYYENEKMKKSVTTLVHDMFPQFNKDKTAEMLFKRHFDNDKSDYYHMTVDDILQKWENNKNEACSKGTELHKNIELTYNDVSVNDETIEYQYFQDFHNDHKFLVPYRTEWEVYYEEKKIAGSIDMIFQNPDGSFSIYDWKRCKKIEKSNKFEFGLYELDHLPNSNFWHYSLQLNIYKYILLKKYDFFIKDMFLVVCHPNNKKYMKYECPDLQNEVSLIFDKLS